ncbi:hypothetical protein COMNV_00580 [Commensalibacter sp. Nvir]|uniref:type II toxin-antitoxin system RelB/DinJ family antitoxin n=1 Tax=Commensalibacter sp. Nvir TaxID=3069817 RepID=UPI002D65C0B0|nr:hypothetical protein COMNV_00580 [Commensalibacter sp. Nvir]
MHLQETYVRARIDQDIKEQAEKTLKSMGITTSDYIRIALIRLIDEQAIPFQIKTPNATTVKAIKEARERIRTGHSSLKSKAGILNDLRALRNTND